jgi:ATP-dependent DNA helicase RecG
MVRVFSRVRRQARAWITAPSDSTLERVTATAEAATTHVPESRQSDWKTLLAGFRAEEVPPRRRARVESLIRACTLFEREERDRERQADRLDWEQPARRAEGVGPIASEKLAANGVEFIGDLIWTLPVGWDDLRTPLSVQEATAMAREREAVLGPPPRQCIGGVVKSASLVPMRRRRAVRVVVEDLGGKAALDAWWFYAAHGVLAVARPGTACLLIGRLRAKEGKRLSMAHPDVVRDDDSVRGVRPRYAPLGVSPGVLRRAIHDAVARTPRLPDPVPAPIVSREAMPEAEPLLRAVHGVPAGTGEPAEARRAMAERLAWVEAFTRVWQRIRAEQAWGAARAPVLAHDPQAVGRVVASLGFALTNAQRRATDVVARDLASPAPMRRLLLGDVGTGKTAVALAAAAQCVAAGYQCAFLVPTALLLDQYIDAVAPLVRALGVRLERMAASLRPAERQRALAAIASGEAQLVVGTHALLEQSVAFARLGLVVVDEQQRLGVAQRLTLVRKGERNRPHLLSLSATPIPRTLALALRGELATSVLDERPQGRGVVPTELCPRARLDVVLREVKATVARGERVFFVCPRIDDDAEEEQIGAEAWGERLSGELSKERVVIVHGGLPEADRSRAMHAFRHGKAQVLVGTTVVEVGLDVPEATLMVVDSAERFGLAQLHQLRGRVGRGARPGRCVLVHEEPLVDLAAQRLATLVRSQDGAEIARADLALRGAGDLGGTRQSGAVEDFAWLDPVDPPSWIARIESDANAILARDPTLAAPEHRGLAMGVRRFARAIAVREEAG